MKKTIVLMLFLVTVLILSACTATQTEPEVDDKQTVLEIITPEAALDMLESEEEVLLLDVRTQVEYDEIHIPGSTLIPVEEFDTRMDEISSWKDKTIIVYCRTGRRSAQAARQLSDNGYEIVYDLGGIYDWPYETVTG